VKLVLNFGGIRARLCGPGHPLGLLVAQTMRGGRRIIAPLQSPHEMPVMAWARHDMAAYHGPTLTEDRLSGFCGPWRPRGVYRLTGCHDRAGREIAVTVTQVDASEIRLRLQT
jgi:hypothetical protein